MAEKRMTHSFLGFQSLLLCCVCVLAVTGANGSESKSHTVTPLNARILPEVTITPIERLPNPSSAAVCIAKWQGPNAGFLTSWFTGDERYATYQDPSATGCSSTYPFAVTKVVWRVTNQTASLLTVNMQPTIYSVDPMFPNCPRPGNVIFNGPTYQVNIPALSTVLIGMPLQTQVCVTGPYFSGVECPINIGSGKLGINLDSSQVVPRRLCANYNDFQNLWEDVISIYNFPGNVMLWSEGENSLSNSCPTGGACCVGVTGNVDCSLNGQVDIGDLTSLIDHLFVTFGPLCCLDEGNVDAAAGVDIGDLTYLIDHLFISFIQLPACP